MLIIEKSTDKKVRMHVNTDPVIVGSKWTGKPQWHIDSTSGRYWEVMPTMTDGERLIQAALLHNKRFATQKVKS